MSANYPRLSVIERDSTHGHRESANGINHLLERVSILESWIVELVPSGYGAARLDIPEAFTLGAGWTTLPFDTQVLFPRGVSIDLGTDTFTLLVAGVWRYSVGFSLEGHNSSNGGRVTRLRVFNVTQGIGATEFVVGIGRNVEDTSASLTVIFDAPNNTDVYRVELGNGDDVTGGTLNASNVSLNYLDRLGNL